MTGKYQTYSKYDAAGDDCWFGCVPSHWEVKKISYVAQLKSGDSIVSEQIEAEGDYPVYGGNGHRGYTSKFNHEGDYILIGRQGALCGNINYASGQFWASEHAVVVHPTVKVSLKWLGETLRAMDLNQYNVSAAQPGLAVANITCLKIPYPNIVEQENIASFLDHETAKIDTLIDKQQQLIQLLKEKRQAVISHAVTKGLNPNAPMRDSGVEWLGKVPEHWVVTQLKFYTLDMQTGPFGSQLHAEDYVTNEIPLINPAHMVSGELIPDPNVTVDEATQERLSRHKLFAGDIIFARRGELGRCAVVQEEHEGWLCGTGSLKAKLNKLLIPEYAYLLITSEGVVSELSLESKGSTMDNLNTETLGRVRIPVPPESEQNEILQYVESVSGKYASLVTKAETAINLMQERRTALISAAVTGKIDVRHHVSRPTGNDTSEVVA